MEEIKDFAVENMAPLLGSKSPSLQIHLAKAYDVQKWLEPGFTRLVERSEAIDEEDVRLIGLAEALKACRLREETRDAQLAAALAAPKQPFSCRYCGNYD